MDKLVLKLLGWMFKSWIGNVILTAILLFGAFTFFGNYNQINSVPYNSIEKVSSAEIGKLQNGKYFKTDVAFIEPLGSITSTKSKFGIKTSSSDNYFALIETAEKSPLIVDLKAKDIKPTPPLTAEQEIAYSKATDFTAFRKIIGDANPDFIGTKVFKKTSKSSKFIFKDSDLGSTLFSSTGSKIKVDDLVHAEMVTESIYSNDKSTALLTTNILAGLGLIMTIVTLYNLWRTNKLKINNNSSL